MRMLFIVSFCVAISACANPYEEFFKPNSSYTDDPQFIIPFKGEPKLIAGTTHENDLSRMTEDGYALIGFSSFNAGEISSESAIAQAKKLGAARIVIYKEYAHSVTGVLPLTVPNTQTTFHSGSISGFGGFGTYGGTSTTYGTTTTYLPYTANRYDYVATFWAKMKEGGLGVTLTDLTPAQRRAIESNKGASIVSVRRGSAAYEADIVPGDILKRVEGVEVDDHQSAVTEIKRNLGQTVELLLLRNGRAISKSIHIPSFE